MNHLRWGSCLRLEEIGSLRPIPFVARVGVLAVRLSKFVSVSAVLTAAMLLPMAALTPDAPKALTAPRQRVETADYRVSGHLVRVDANGSRMSFPINLKARWFPGVLRVFIEIGTGSKTSANSSITSRVPAHILLEMRPGGPNVVKIAHPGDKSPVILPFDKWSNGPLGNGFSYEDLLEAQYFWAGQTALGEKKFGARDCDVVKSTPGAADMTHDAEVTSWLDHRIGFPVYVEKTLKDGTVKEFTYFGLRQNGGVWSASQVEVKIRGQAGSTLLMFDRGTPKANLALKDFAPAQLMHF